MGWRGVKAHESDSGLDYLGLFKKENLEKVGYKHFDIKAARIFLHNHIIGVITKENKGCSKKDMDFYIDANFPYEYGVATMLIAECLVETLEQAANRTEGQNERLHNNAFRMVDSFVLTALKRVNDENALNEYAKLKVLFLNGEEGTVEKLSALKKIGYRSWHIKR